VRSIEDASEANVTGYDYTAAHIVLDHEYRRNILLQGYVGLQRADYAQSTSSETYYQGGAGVTWLINRNVRAGLTYNLTDRQGNFGQNYLQNVYLLQIRLGL
jgi:hypothetical protein